MKNLKKALSMVLASAMLFGMMVVGTGAAHADVTAEHNVEAIKVVSHAGIMGANEEFNPDAKITRNEMAVVMVNMLGLDTDDFAGASTFTDVPAWAADYVDACYANGIVSGVSATEFNGGANVTTAEAALMVMKALDYFQYSSDFGSDWMLATIKQASKIDLLEGVNAKANATLTRNEVAQLVLNALEADVVVVDEPGTEATIIKTNDIDVTIPGKAATYVADSALAGIDYDVTTGATNGATLQLIEKLYGEDYTKDAGATDKLGRPATKWVDTTDDDAVIVTAADKADEIIVVNKAGKSVQYWIETLDKDFVATGIVYNGAASSASSVKLGAEIEVFLNDDGDAVTNVLVNTVDLVKINKVTEATNKDYDYTVKLGTKTYTDDKLAGFDADTMKKDDYVVVQYNAAGEVVFVEVAETIEGKITSTGKSGAVAIDGTGYTKTITTDLAGNALNFDDTYAFYMVNGYVYAAKVVEEAEKSDGYVYVLSFATQGYQDSKLGIGGKDVAAKAEVLFLDGTIEILDLDIKKADKAYGAIAEGDYYIEFCGNKYEVANDMSATLVAGFYEYTLNADGEITLDAIDTDYATAETVDAGKIVKDSIDLGDGFTANSSTKLVVIEAASGDETADVVLAESAGFKNFPKTAIATDAKVLFVYEKDSTVAKTVYVLDTVTTNETTYAYYTGNYTNLSATKTTYEFIINGETVSFELTSGMSGAAKGDVFVINEAAKSASAKTAYTQIVTEVDEYFFQTSAPATVVYADKYNVYDMTGDEAVKGEVAEGDSVIYVLNASGKVEIVYIIDSIIGAQPETRLEAKEILDAEAGDYWSLWYELPTLGLTQNVDGNEVTISGKLDAIDATNFDEYKAAISQWMGPVTDFDNMLTVLAADNRDVAGVTAVGFVLLEVDGNTAVTMLVNQNGNVRCLKNATTTLNWAGVSFDFAGLSF